MVKGFVGVEDVLEFASASQVNTAVQLALFVFLLIVHCEEINGLVCEVKR